MNWAEIPSLAALRAFEAAARTGSLSAAARELNVTHAAIAQHVRTLEEHLSTSLLAREGRSMAPTEAGATLAKALSDGFGQIAAGVRAVNAAHHNRPVSLTLTPSLAENWLMPRLPSFWSSHPNITLSITPSISLSDLRGDGHDIGIRYGRGPWPGYTSEFLLSARYAVVASPDLIGDLQINDLSELSDFTWLFDPLFREPRRWAESNGLTVDESNVIGLGTSSMILSAARTGAGLAILSRAIIEEDLQRGSLKIVLEAKQEELGYYVVLPSPVASPRVKTLVAWLKSQAQATED